VRKVFKTKGHLPTDEAAMQLLYLSTRRAVKWKRAPPYWLKARQQFEIFFPDRLSQEAID